MLTRILFFSILLLIIDLLAFQAVKQLTLSSSKSLKTIVYVLYWMVPVITVLYMTGYAMGWGENLPKTLQVIVRSMIFIFYFSKLLIAVIILIDDLRRLVFGALNFGIKDINLSTTRSRWMSYGALILGAIPV